MLAYFVRVALLARCGLALVRSVPAMSAGHALIVQNSGGGHGEIGFALAKELSTKGLGVTLLQDAAAKKSALPFCLYDSLPAGVDVVWSDDVTSAAAVEAAVKGKTVTHIFDNFAKCEADAAAAISLAQASAAFYAFVSSAGMYTKSGLLKETGPVKVTGQREVELSLEAALPARWCAFRPQYIYGPAATKRTYLDWFLNRVARGIPMAVPGDAQQPVSLTHVEDVAKLMACVVGNEAKAGGELFNCGTSKMCSYDDVCLAAAEALGKPKPVIASLAVGTKSSFPFRPTMDGFAVRTRKAKDVLGWPGSQHDVLDDLKAWYKDDFLALKLDEGELDTSKDKLDEAANLVQDFLNEE